MSANVAAASDDANVDAASDLKRGDVVTIKGLVKAAQHNGKRGRIAKAPGEDGRYAVKLAGGATLSVKRANLEAAPPAAKRPAPTDDTPEPRTLSRHHQLLAEFDGKRDPDMQAMYFHFRSMAFDAYNVAEYHSQMERYYRFETKVVCVVPRAIRGNLYALVCLQHKKTEQNNLCELAFQCMRQFAGVSILLKRTCFVCHRPNSPLCEKCHCAAFCSAECAREGWGAHNIMCQLIQHHGAPKVEEEVVTIF